MTARLARPTLAGIALLVSLALVAPPGPAAAGPGKPPATRGFGLDDVARRAQSLAAADYQDPGGRLPAWLGKLSYDEWRDIRYRPEKALWRSERLPFQVQLFHPGLFYDRAVAISVVDERGVHAVPFSPSFFDYGKNDFGSKVPQDLGYAGFRIHAPIKGPRYFDELIVFLGASYFRAVGRDQLFGISARGLAIDTAQSTGEEFPWFREFWLVKPAPGAASLTIFALLDSPSLTGAFRFVVSPGEQTSVDTDARIFRRKDVAKLGLAPLTSMFLQGETGGRSTSRFQPEIHDSDGLLLQSGAGEWLWRPLENPESLQVNSFEVGRPRGFGLIQRDRSFDHYQDIETRQELRPSVWVEPRAGWPDGRVELVQIPTRDDTNDNVVAYFVPAKLPPIHEPIDFSYRLSWYGDDARRPPAGRVVATRREPGQRDGSVRYVVDFEGPDLRRLDEKTVLRGVVTAAGGDEAGEITDEVVVKNPVTGGWRLSFQVVPKQPPTELRAFLDQGGRALTETWSSGVTP